MTVTRGRSCVGKVARTKRDAENEARRAWIYSFGRVAAYRCRFCGAWHVGHRPRRRR